MQFEIRDAFRYTSSASLADVVYAIRYEFNDSGSSAVGSNLNTEVYRYFLQLDPVSSGELVAFNTVATSSGVDIPFGGDEEVVDNHALQYHTDVNNRLKGWVQASHGGNWGTFTSSLATTISASLAERVDARPSSVFHWPSGSHTIDALEIQSGSVWAGF
tara:strand:+ start:302 stop:781 length:480 start_codon:yes stop_codon:yes gene_type:complete